MSHSHLFHNHKILYISDCILSIYFPDSFFQFNVWMTCLFTWYRRDWRHSGPPHWHLQLFLSFKHHFNSKVIFWDLATNCKTLKFQETLQHTVKPVLVRLKKKSPSVTYIDMMSAQLQKCPVSHILTLIWHRCWLPAVLADPAPENIDVAALRTISLH